MCNDAVNQVFPEFLTNELPVSEAKKIRTDFLNISGELMDEEQERFVFKVIDMTMDNNPHKWLRFNSEELWALIHRQFKIKNTGVRDFILTAHSLSQINNQRIDYSEIQ